MKRTPVRMGVPVQTKLEAKNVNVQRVSLDQNARDVSVRNIIYIRYIHMHQGVQPEAP